MFVCMCERAFVFIHDLSGSPKNSYIQRYKFQDYSSMLCATSSQIIGNKFKYQICACASVLLMGFSVLFKKFF